MSSPALYNRIVRRESHSSRSGAAITIAVILMIVLAYLGVESVLAAIGQKPLLVAPEALVSSALSAASSPVALLVAIGAVVAIIGLVLIITSFTPGRRGRRGSIGSRTAAVVDDRVIAQSIARTVSYASDIDPDNVNVTVGTRTVRIDVTPTSGRPLDTQAIQDAVAADVASYDYRPALRTRVHVAKKGRVAR